MNQPLAYVHPQAKIARNVVIEPFTTIHNNVIIGSGTWIGSNVTIMEGARIGKNCRIFPGAVISGIPQLGLLARNMRCLNKRPVQSGNVPKPVHHAIHKVKIP